MGGRVNGKGQTINSNSGVGLIPSGSKKMVQSLKEIVNCSEVEIYAMLKECNMDPNEAVNRLLSQDPFHEVKSKREKKKETKDATDSRSRGTSSTSSRGGRGSIPQFRPSDSSSRGKPVYKDNGSTAYTSSFGPGTMGNNANQQQPHFSDASGTMDKRALTMNAAEGISSAHPSTGFQSSWAGVPGQISMADIVQMGRSYGKPASNLNPSQQNADHYPSLVSSSAAATHDLHPSQNHAAKVSETNYDSGVVTSQHVPLDDDDWPIDEQPPAASVSSAVEPTVDSEPYNDSYDQEDQQFMSENDVQYAEDDDPDDSHANYVGQLPGSTSNLQGERSGVAPIFDNDLCQKMNSYQVQQEEASQMAGHQSHLSSAFPTKPRLKPTSKKPNSTAESKYWKSFKHHQITGLITPVTSLSFSPSPPHLFAASHSASLSLFSPHHPFSPTDPVATISSDVAYSVSFRSDGKLLAAGGESGVVKVFETKSRTALRQLRGHKRAVRLVRYPHFDKQHLFSGGEDAVVKYWDVAAESRLGEFLGHKDYVTSGCGSPIDDNLFATGSYDHTIRVWDVRVSNSGSSAMVFNHGNLVEDVVFLPSGGLIATAGGNVVKIWDVIGGGKCIYSMEGHNKTVTSICAGRVGRDSGESSEQHRLLSVSLDGYLKVFDYSNMKTTVSMRFPAPLLSVAFSPDCATRVIGTSNGIIYMGKRKKGKTEEDEPSGGGFLGLQYKEELQKRVLKPSFYRYFHRGQSEKPREGDYLVLRPKKVKFQEHDKLLKKFRHKDAFVSVLRKKNPENVVAVMEELVTRRKLMNSVMNLDEEELGLLLGFLQKYTTMPRYSSLLMGLANKVLETRGEDIRASDVLIGHVKNLKRSVQEEIRIQHALLELQGIISPLMRIAGRR